MEPLENFGDNSNMFDDTQTPKPASAIDQFVELCMKACKLDYHSYGKYDKINPTF